MWVFTLRFIDLLREDRKGLSLGTDILCSTTPYSYRQDLIFAFSQRGREGKQRLVTSTAVDSVWRDHCRNRDYNERFECEEVRLTLPLP